MPTTLNASIANAYVLQLISSGPASDLGRSQSRRRSACSRRRSVRGPSSLLEDARHVPPRGFTNVKRTAK